MAPVPGCLFTQVLSPRDKWLWQPVQVPMNSQCTLKSGMVSQPGAAIVLESWGYLKQSHGGAIVRGEATQAKESGKCSSVGTDQQWPYQSKVM